jgi:DnaJ homolog subfamily C member 19
MKFGVFLILLIAFFWLGRSALQASGQMSVNEAAKLLDVAPDADADAINAAHRRLIAKVHPDAGGTAELAARINQARDLLLKRLR